MTYIHDIKSPIKGGRNLKKISSNLNVELITTNRNKKCCSVRIPKMEEEKFCERKLQLFRFPLIMKIRIYFTLLNYSAYKNIYIIQIQTIGKNIIINYSKI